MTRSALASSLQELHTTVSKIKKVNFYKHNVMCDFIHLLVLVSNCGKAYTFGLASVGQLGHGGTKKLYNVSQMRFS